MVSKLEKVIKASGLTEAEVAKIIKASQRQAPKVQVKKKLPLSDKHIKFGWISDLHMGHNCYRPDILEHAVKNFNKQKVEFVVIPGDILEGMSGREGHIYELSHIGASAQMKYGVEQLKQIRQPIFAITATNSHDGWYHSKNNAGLEIGPELERRLGKDNFEFLGYDEADIKLDNGIIIRAVHPGDGTAYAISYKMQKYLNALTGGEKPNVVLQGHYHKYNQMWYRNVLGIDCGTACDQTIFMRKKQTPAHTGYGITDVYGDKKGLERAVTEFVPFYT